MKHTRIKGIVLFLLFFVLFYVKLNIFKLTNSSNNSINIVEGYTKHDPAESYTNCIETGYGSDFCSQTPIYNVSSKQLKYCNCAGNRYGTYQFDNKCNCVLNNPKDYIYVSQLFQNYR